MILKGSEICEDVESSEKALEGSDWVSEGSIKGLAGWEGTE